jgi:2-succinyl-6-hydroxy-2,4-cyclohexadiene-1-carboxylate synthase
MPQIRVDGGDLYYQVKGQGPAITLLHGFTQRGESWREAALQLGAAWTVIVPDLRGHGRTTVPSEGDHSQPAAAADLRRLWDHLEVSCSHLVGYSMGGRLALHVAATSAHDIRSLVVVSGHAGLSEPERGRRREADSVLAEHILAVGIEQFAREWGEQQLFSGVRRRGREYTERLVAMRRANRPESLAASLRDMGAGAMASLWEELRSFDRPALILAGGEDLRYRAFGEQLAETLPNARLELIEGAGHALPQERPKEVGIAIARFLREVEVSEPRAGVSYPQ